jgi:hypothetical protein
MPGCDTSEMGCIDAAAPPVAVAVNVTWARLAALATSVCVPSVVPGADRGASVRAGDNVADNH